MLLRIKFMLNNIIFLNFLKLNNVLLFSTIFEELYDNIYKRYKIKRFPRISGTCFGQHGC